MSDSLSPLDDKPPESAAAERTAHGGGADLTAQGDINIGGDVVGRDKLTTIGYTVEQVSSLLTQINATFQPKPFDGRCPYLGLDAFSEEDADRFFGRDTLVNELVARVEVSRFVITAGPSGSGKSSLVRAGLIHALKQGVFPNSNRWLYATLTPGRDPCESLALAMSRLAKSPDAGDYIRRHLSEADALHKFAESLLSDRKDQRAVIFVDQFEEVFTQVAKEDERVAFLNLLAGAATMGGGRVTVLFALRSDFVSNCATYPQLNALLNQQFMQVGAMQPDELVSAIARPALQVGLRIDPDLIAQIVYDMRDEPGALPLMQFALKDLFDAQQTQGGVIALTLSDYLARGGLRKSLERHADAAFAKLSEPEQQLARSVFSGLIEIGRGTADTRRTALFDELVPVDADTTTVKVLVQKLADARLITTDEQGNQDTVTIAHERLIEAWPWLYKLVNENREAIALQNQLAEDAQEWENNQRDASYLYVGARLANAREQFAANKIVLSGLAHAFIEASVEAKEAERQLAEARRQKELDDARKLAETEKLRAEEQAHSAARLRQTAAYLIGALVVALLLGIAAGLFGVQSNLAANEARRQSQLSRSRELAAVSIANLDLDPELSLHLAMRAISDTYTLQGEDALRRAVLSPPVALTLHGHSGAVYSVAYDHEGKRLVTASEDKTARIWDAATGRELVVLRGHTDAVKGAVFSPDGRLIATASADKTVRIWDAETGQPLRSLNKHSGAINSVAFSPNGQHLVTASDDKTVRVWQVESGNEVDQLGTHAMAVYSAVFSQNGKWIATGEYDPINQEYITNIWNATTGQRIKTLPNGIEGVSAIAFSPDSQSILTTWGYNARRWDLVNDLIATEYTGSHTFYVTGVTFNPSDGRQVVTASRDHTVRIWDTESGYPIGVLRGHSGTVYAVAFDPGGDHLATASEDQTVRVWDIAEWRKHTLIGHTDMLNGAAYSFDGRRIATTSQDGTIRIWDAQSGRELKVWPYPGWVASGVSFSPDDRHLMTASDDGTARIWDADTGEQEPVTTTITNIVHDARFNHDGTRIITTNRDHFGYIWDAGTKQLLARLDGHTDWVASGMFSPDGQMVVTASADGTARLWETQTGKPVRVLKKHSGLVTKAAFSTDGKRIVTAGVDGTARIWDAASGQELHILTGHTAEVTDAAFSPDDKYVATASRDHTARLWNADTGEEIIQLLGHTKDLRTVAFSPDGRYLVTASLDGTARIYPVQFEDVLALARSLLSPRELTCAERVKYLHEDVVCSAASPIVTPAP